MRESITRRTWLKTAGAGAGTAVVAGCLGDSDDDATDDTDDDGDDTDDPDGEAEGETITPRSAGGAFGDLLEESFYEPYNEDPETIHTIDPSFGDQGPAEADIRANPEDPPFSLFYNTNTTFFALSAAEYVRSDVPDLVSQQTLDNVSDAAVMDEMIGDLLAPLGIVINRDEVDQEITSWTDLHDPEFEGRVGFPQWGLIGRDLFYFLNHVLGGSIDDIQPGLDYMEGLVDNDVTIWESSDHGLRLVNEEEIVVSPFFNARAEQARADADAEIEFVYPDEGGFLQLWGFSVLTDLPEEELDATTDFYDWMFADPARVSRLADGFGYHVSVVGWEDEVEPETLEDNEFIPIPEDDLDEMGRVTEEVDWRGAVEHHDEHAEEFDRVIRG